MPALTTKAGLQNDLCAERDDEWTGWNVVPVKVISRNNHGKTEKWVVKADTTPPLERSIIRQRENSYWKLDIYEDVEPYVKAIQIKLEKEEKRWQKRETTKNKKQAHEERAQQFSAATDQWNVTGVDPWSGSAGWNSGRATNHTSSQGSGWEPWQTGESGGSAMPPVSKVAGLSKTEKEELKEMKTRLDAITTRTEDNAAKIVNMNINVAEIKKETVTKSVLNEEVKQAIKQVPKITNLEKMMMAMMAHQGIPLPSGEAAMTNDADMNSGGKEADEFAISTPSREKAGSMDGSENDEGGIAVEENNADGEGDGPKSKKGRTGKSPGHKSGGG